MKILYITDSHISGKTPVHRIDNFYEAIMLKTEQVFEIANKEKCDLVINGGDLFDSPVLSLRIIDDFINLVDKLKMPLYTIVGNHDQNNCLWDTEDATSIAHLIRLGKINLLEKYYSPVKKGDKGSLNIDGFNYTYDIEDKIQNGLLMMKEKPADYNIAVVHAMITEGSNPFKCISYKDIQTNYDLVLCSHNHVSFGIKTCGKTIYVSPGAFSRRSIDEKTCIQPISHAIIDTETREVRLVPLTSAKPYEEVFDLFKIAEQKENAKKLDLFVSALKSAKIQSLSVAAVLEEVCKASNVDDETKDLILRRIHDGL